MDCLKQQPANTPQANRGRYLRPCSPCHSSAATHCAPGKACAVHISGMDCLKQQLANTPQANRKEHNSSVTISCCNTYSASGKAFLDCTACSSSRPTPKMQSERAHHAPNTSLSTRKNTVTLKATLIPPQYQRLAHATNSPPLFSLPHTHCAPRKAFPPLNTSPAARPAEGCACTMNIGVGV